MGLRSLEEFILGDILDLGQGLILVQIVRLEDGEVLLFMVGFVSQFILNVLVPEVLESIMNYWVFDIMDLQVLGVKHLNYAHLAKNYLQTLHYLIFDFI